MNKKLIKCKQCNEEGGYIHEDGICTKCKYYSICKSCNKERHNSDMLENGICKYCDKIQRKIIEKHSREEKKRVEKLENSYKPCPFCCEKIKAMAKKCKFCGEMLKEEGIIKNELTSINKTDVLKEVKKESSINKGSEIVVEEKMPKSPVLALVFGILSIFFYEIGIIPLIGVVASIFAMTKYKLIGNRYRAFAIIGSILSVVYFLMNILVYSQHGPLIKF